MSDEEMNSSDGRSAAGAGIAPEQPAFDEHTTEPNAPARPKETEKSVGKWQMPKPKFQQTSGYLPKGYAKNIGVNDGGELSAAGSSSEFPAAPAQPFAAAAPPEPRADGAVAVEPQPDITQLIPEEPVAGMVEAPAPVSSSRSRLPLIVFGVLALAALLIVVLVAVYFLFLAKSSGSNNF